VHTLAHLRIRILPATLRSHFTSKRARLALAGAAPRIHRTEQVAAGAGPARADHVAVTAICHIALAAEFRRRARAADDRPAARSLVLAITTPMSARRRAHAAHWGFMRGDATTPARVSFVMPHIPLAPSGFRAVATAPFMATGRLGAEQIGRLDALLPRPRDFPRRADPSSARRRAAAAKRLTDAAALRAASRHGAELR
jgi:hypothetical protein